LADELSRAFGSIKDGLVDIICKEWEHGIVSNLVSKLFHLHENWMSLSSGGSSPTDSRQHQDVTQTTAIFSQMAMVLVRSLHHISCGNNELPLEDSPEATNLKTEGEMALKLVDRIKVTIFDCLNYVMDGYMWLVTQWRSSDYLQQEKANSGWIPYISHKPLKCHFPENADPLALFVPLEMASGFESSKEKVLQVWRPEIRSILILCNNAFLRGTVVPKLVAYFESKFQSSVSAQVKVHSITQNYTLNSEYLEDIQICNFTKRQAVHIQGYIREGILYSGLDWSSLENPQGFSTDTEIRQHCHHILLTLVLVHATIGEVSKNLVQTVLFEMVQIVAQELLLTIRQVDCFSATGVMQVRFLI
jgi:hypothetical protein